MVDASTIKFIPIGYMTYNWINVIASIVITGFAIWFSVSDDFDITNQKIWVPSIITIGLLTIIYLFKFFNYESFLKNIMIRLCVFILFVVGVSFTIPIALLESAIFTIMNIHTGTIMNLHTGIRFILTYKNLFFVLLFLTSIASYIFFTFNLKS